MKKYSVLLLIVMLVLTVVFSACTKAGDGGAETLDSQTQGQTAEDKGQTTEEETEPYNTIDLVEGVTEEEAVFIEDTYYLFQTQGFETNEDIIYDSDFPEEPEPETDAVLDRYPDGPVDTEVYTFEPETTKSPETTKKPSETTNPETTKSQYTGQVIELPVIPWDDDDWE